MAKYDISGGQQGAVGDNARNVNQTRAESEELPPPKKEEVSEPEKRRSGLVTIIVAVLGLFGAGGAGTYLLQQHSGDKGKNRNYAVVVRENSDSANPISGASVVLAYGGTQGTKYTGTDGRAVFDLGEDAKNSRGHIFVSATGYQAENRDMEIGNSGGSEDFRLNVSAREPQTPPGNPGNKRPQDKLSDVNNPTVNAKTEHWHTVEGEFSGQFSNVWEVRFDGKPFSCAPSQSYGKTLCTAMKSGNEITVKRFVTSDDNPCTFTGTINGDEISGTYQCTRKKGPYDWSATIIH